MAPIATDPSATASSATDPSATDPSLSGRCATPARNRPAAADPRNRPAAADPRNRPAAVDPRNRPVRNACLRVSFIPALVGVARVDIARLRSGTEVASATSRPYPLCAPAIPADVITSALRQNTAKSSATFPAVSSPSDRLLALRLCRRWRQSKPLPHFSRSWPLASNHHRMRVTRSVERRNLAIALPRRPARRRNGFVPTANRDRRLWYKTRVQFVRFVRGAHMPARSFSS